MGNIVFWWWNINGIEGYQTSAATTTPLSSHCSPKSAVDQRRDSSMTGRHYLSSATWRRVYIFSTKGHKPPISSRRESIEQAERALEKKNKKETPSSPQSTPSALHQKRTQLTPSLNPRGKEEDKPLSPPPSRPSFLHSKNKPHLHHCLTSPTRPFAASAPSVIPNPCAAARMTCPP